MPGALMGVALLTGLAVCWPQEVAASVLAVPPRTQPDAGPAPARTYLDRHALWFPRLGRHACVPGRRPRARVLAFAIGTALLLACLMLADLPWPVAAATALLVVFGLPLAVIDIQVRRLPDALTGPAYATVIACLAGASAAAGSWHMFGRVLLGGALLAASYLAVALIRPGHLGAGDAKAAAAIGTVLAWNNWACLLDGTLIAFVLAGIYGGVLLLSRRAAVTARMPLGPFLYAGGYLAVVTQSLVTAR
jgi:leader peptidase (prepilin peptidase) / N-methyltransferase